jgi:hypothetical protein
MTRERGHTGASGVQRTMPEREKRALPGDREQPADLEDITTAASKEDIDPSELPLDLQNTAAEPPLSGTVDDDDNRDDEHEDENEAPTREARDTQETREEFQLDEREEIPGAPNPERD